MMKFTFCMIYPYFLILFHYCITYKILHDNVPSIVNCVLNIRYEVSVCVKYSVSLCISSLVINIITNNLFHSLINLKCASGSNGSIQICAPVERRCTVALASTMCEIVARAGRRKVSDTYCKSFGICS